MRTLARNGVSAPEGRRDGFGACNWVAGRLGTVCTLWNGGCRLVGKGHHHTSLHTPRAVAQAQSLEPFSLVFIFFLISV